MSPSCVLASFVHLGHIVLWQFFGIVIIILNFWLLIVPTSFGILLLLNKLSIDTIRIVAEKGIVISNLSKLTLLQDDDSVSVSNS